MKSDWKEKSCKEKVLSIASMSVGIIAMIFTVIDIADLWQHAHIGWNFSFAAMCGIECVQRWNNNRKIAITELVFCIVLFVFGVLSILL